MNLDFELARAVKAHDIEGVISLIKAGASTNVIDPNDNEHILLNAARRGYGRIATLLIDHGAEVDVISENTGNTPLIEAAARGHLKVVRGLLDYKPNLVHQNNDGLTAREVAAHGRHDKIASLIRKEMEYWAGINAAPCV